MRVRLKRSLPSLADHKSPPQIAAFDVHRIDWEFNKGVINNSYKCCSDASSEPKSMGSKRQFVRQEDTLMELGQRQVALKALYIVYDADGTVAGEVLYLLRKWLGKGHCAACEITHGPKKVKPEWTLLQKTGWLGVPLFNIHRDEMEPKLRTAVGPALPCVAAVTDTDEHLLLLGPTELETCEGQVPKLQEKIVEALEHFGFQLTEGYRPDWGLSQGCVQKNATNFVDNKNAGDAVVPF